MNIEQFREYCLSLAGTTEGMKWDHLCFMIEDKLFVIVAIDDGNGFAIKCEPEEFDALVARDGISQASHFAKRQWISVQGLDVFTDAELKERLKKSRSLVLKKLPKRVQAKYGE